MTMTCMGVTPSVTVECERVRPFIEDGSDSFSLQVELE
jgi:hypothetical protein